MDLWIRSQDKSRLAKIINLQIERTTIIGNTVMNEWDIQLGTYKTKARALEVLDEIQNLLEGRVNDNHINKFDIYNGNNFKIYNMPQE